MKNNILHHFALNDLKIHKKDSLISIITIFIVAMITMILTLTSTVFFNQNYMNYRNEFGTFEYIVDYSQPADINGSVIKLNNENIHINDSRLSVCSMISSGITLNDELINELEGNHDILATRLKNGRMPQNKTEVAIKESVFDHWGYENELNSTIQISYHLNNQSYTSEFKVVGILEETGSTDIAVSEAVHRGNYSLYIEVLQPNSKLTSDKLTINEGGFNDELGSATVASIYMFIQVIILIISFALLYGLTLSSFESRENDYTLLRSIGATKRQIYYVIFIQSLMISIIPIVLSMILTYIISFIIPQLIKLPFALSFQFLPILWNAIVIFMVSFVSYFIPARSACRKAMIGTFEGQEFQYFYYQYKKAHYLNALYLGWRQLASLKKKSIVKIFFIFMITLLSMQAIGNQMMKQEIIREDLNYIESLNTTISYELIDIENSFVAIEDFDFYKPYAKEVRFVNYMSEDRLTEKFFETEPQSQYPELYSANDDVKEIYDIKNIKKGQIILSDRYLESYKDKYKIHDKIIFLGDEYELIEIKNNDFKDLAFLSKEDFQKYGDVDKDKIVSVLLKDIQHKTALFLEQPTPINKLKDKYIQLDNNLEAQKNILKAESKTSSEMEMYFLVATVIGISILYIYQFSFELLKQKEDIGTYQILGFQKIVIWQIYIYKSLMIGVMGFLLGNMVYLLDAYYFLGQIFKTRLLFQTSVFPTSSLFASTVVLIVIILSVFPLKKILKNEGLENKNTRE